MAHVVALQRAGYTFDRILDVCPELTAADVDAAQEWYTTHGEVGLGPRPLEPGDRHPRVCIDPDVQGGHPTIKGTRITVDAILGLWEEGVSVDEILHEYPALTHDDVDDALAYDAESRG